MAIQQKQRTQHMLFMHEQMKAFMPAVADAKTVPTVQAAEPKAMAASAAAVTVLGFEGSEADDPRVMRWSKAFDNPKVVRRSDPRYLAAIKSATAVFRKKKPPTVVLGSQGQETL